MYTNPERVRRESNPFRVDRCFYSFDPRVVAALQLWAEISQRLRRICQRVIPEELGDFDK
jgi:hypothetical protein